MLSNDNQPPITPQPITVEKFLDDLLKRAVFERASDIHIEPLSDHTLIRFRIDGILHEAMRLPVHNLEPILVFIKVTANLDITNKPVPQDGHFEFAAEAGLLLPPETPTEPKPAASKNTNKEPDALSRLYSQYHSQYQSPRDAAEKPIEIIEPAREISSGDQKIRHLDVRVSVFPTVNGEAAVLRLLNREEMLISLDKLGMDSQTLGIIKKMIFRPYGMVLITGPAGSGKTTTLYAILNEIRQKEKNIITLEDPIEFKIDGIRQIQINPAQGFDFVTGVRSILRQDPDAVMIGEIRDSETTENAIRSSLSGKIFFSTIHANTAVGTIARLLDMNIERGLIAYALQAVIAQRLVPKICDQCRISYAPDPKLISYLGLDAASYKFTKGQGCAKCGKTGFFGRAGLFESFEMDNTLRSLIIEKTPIHELERYIESMGMKTLKQDAREKVLAGVITVEEAARSV